MDIITKLRETHHNDEIAGLVNELTSCKEKLKRSEERERIHLIELEKDARMMSDIAEMIDEKNNKIQRLKDKLANSRQTYETAKKKYYI